MPEDYEKYRMGSSNESHQRLVQPISSSISKSNEKLNIKLILFKIQI